MTPEYRRYAEAEREKRKAEAEHRDVLYRTGRMELRDKPGAPVVRYLIPARDKDGKDGKEYRQGWIVTADVGGKPYRLVAQTDRDGHPAIVVHHASGYALGARAELPPGRSIRLRVQAHVDRLVAAKGADYVRHVIDGAAVINASGADAEGRS